MNQLWNGTQVAKEKPRCPGNTSQDFGSVVLFICHWQEGLLETLGQQGVPNGSMRT